MIDHPLYVITVLAANVVLAQTLERYRGFRSLGAALLVIVTTAVCVNTGLLPSYADGVPVYDGIFAYVAPLGIFWLLLQVELRQVLRAGGPMLALFVVGAAGVMIGVVAGMRVIGGASAFGDAAAGLGAMFTGTYIGGSVNFNAMAMHTGIAQESVLYVGANAVDASMTTVWMMITILVPRLLSRGRASTAGRVASADVGSTADADAEAAVEALRRESVRCEDLAWLLMIGAAAMWLSDQVEAWTSLPSILVLSSIALVLAQLPSVQRLKGGGVLGMLAVMLFLAVIGALSDIAQFRALGAVGIDLLWFVAILLSVHGVVLFGVARVLRLDPASAAVASQAAIGGGTSALALARTLGRQDLELPAVLVGSLGLALGNYAGLAVLAVMS